jgi:(p)ppGpp synthase/HD superfamily hydrolase
MMLGPRFTEALGLANELHAGQTRKASQVPYLSHVLNVAATVLEYGGDEDVAIAALLHDVVEDCGGMATAALLTTKFGERVTSIVLGCSDTTESPKPPWQDRKERYLAHLPDAPPEVLLVSAADKLHNLQSLLREERRMGPALWRFFRAGREGTLWYYEQLLHVFRQAALPAELVDQIEPLVDALRARIEAQRSLPATSGPAPAPDGPPEAERQSG